jgi:hypothetical protein
VFLVIACIWIWLVSTTIPGGFGGGDIGPRAFPLTFGIALAILSALLIFQSLRAAPESDPVPEIPDEPVARTAWLPAALVLVEICLYGFLLQKVGFVIATPIIILLIMLANLRVRSIKLLLGMSIGLTLGSWLIFEKVLGIYMANGSWINLG